MVYVENCVTINNLYSQYGRF